MTATPERCPRCDRAECLSLVSVPDAADARTAADAWAIGEADCQRHELTRADWRQRALDAEAERDALRASFASQAQVTVTARQAVSDVVVQRNAAEARADAAEANDAHMCLAVHAEADAIGDIAQTFELGPMRAALYAVVDRLRRVAGDRAALKETP